MTNATNKGLNILETSVLTPSINTFFLFINIIKKFVKFKAVKFSSFLKIKSQGVSTL